MPAGDGRMGEGAVAVTREANLQLERVWEQTGWSRKELARRVNQHARRRGAHLNTDASRVRYWLQGQQPQPPVPELLSELFSEQLGYPITPGEIGLKATDQHELGLRYPEGVRTYSPVCPIRPGHLAIPARLCSWQ